MMTAPSVYSIGIGSLIRPSCNSTTLIRPCSPRMWIQEKVRMVKLIQNGTISSRSSSHLCRNVVAQMK